MDLQAKISQNELSDYINELGNDFENLEISLKTQNNLELLWEKVYNYVNKTSNEIPINLIEERIEIIERGTSNYIKTEGSIHIILIGDSGVGKTNLFSRYFQNKFVDQFISTIGMDRQTKIIKYKNKIYNIHISDTAGQERFRSIPIRYYQNADGVLLLYDINDINSFENIKVWMKDLEINKTKSKQIIYLIGNKIDLPERNITQDEGSQMAKSFGLPYYEMSCKINMNINEIISRLIVDCFNNLIDNENNGFKVKNKKSKKNKKCC